MVLTTVLVIVLMTLTVPGLLFIVTYARVPEGLMVMSYGCDPTMMVLTTVLVIMLITLTALPFCSVT